jgi:hypothetical protein
LIGRGNDARFVLRRRLQVFEVTVTFADTVFVTITVTGSF